MDWFVPVTDTNWYVLTDYGQDYEVCGEYISATRYLMLIMSRGEY